MDRVMVLERQNRQKRASERKAQKAAFRHEVERDELQISEDGEELEENDEPDDSDGESAAVQDQLRNSSAAYSWATGLPNPQDPKDSIPKYADLFRPHHYFDYFFGTSTGGQVCQPLYRPI